MSKAGVAGGLKADTIKAIGRAQMQGPFHVEEVQAPHSQISLGQEFFEQDCRSGFLPGRRFRRGGKLGIAEVVRPNPSRDYPRHVYRTSQDCWPQFRPKGFRRWKKWPMWSRWRSRKNNSRYRSQRQTKILDAGGKHSQKPKRIKFSCIRKFIVLDLKHIIVRWNGFF